MTESIVLEVDSRSAREGAAKVNAGLESIEKKSLATQASLNKGAQVAGDSIMRITDRSRTSIDRMLNQIERRAAFAGKTGVDRLIAERDMRLRQLGGEEQAIARMTAAYDKLIGAERERLQESSKMEEALRSPWEAAQNAVGGFLQRIGPAGAIMGAAAAGLGFLAKKAFDLVAASGAAAEVTLNLGDRLDITGREAFKLQSVAGIAGVNIEAMQAAAVKLAAALEDGSGEGRKASAALRELGISTIQPNGELRQMGEVTLEVIDKLAGVASASERVRLANQLLGRGGKELIPMLNAIREWGPDLEKAGLILDTQLLKRLAEADDQIGKMDLSWRVFKAKLADAIQPIVVPVVVSITRILTQQERNQPGTVNVRTAGMGGALVSDRAQGVTEIGNGLAYGIMGGVGQQTGIDERLTAGERRAKEYAAREERTLQGIEQRLKVLQSDRLKLDTELRQAGQTDTAHFIKERQLRGLDRDIANLEAAKKSLEDAAAREARRIEEQRRLREHGLELINEAQRLRGRDLTGTRDEIKLEKIDDRPDFARIEADRLRATLDADSKIIEMRLGTADKALAYEQDILRQGYEAQMRQAQSVRAMTIEQKLAVEEKKLEIERKYLMDSFTLKAAELEREQSMELAKAGQSAEDRSAIIERYGEAGRQLMRTQQDLINSTTQDAAIRMGQMVQDEHLRMWENVRRGFENTIDALWSKTQSFGDYVKNILTAAFLTPLKQAASAWFADLFTPMASGMRGGFGGARMGLGSVAGGMVGGFGMSGNSGSPLPASVAMLNPFRGGGSGGSRGFGMFNPFAGWKNSLSGLGNIGYGPKGGDFGGEVAGSYRGVGGWQGGAMLAGGGLLAMDGLRRGGVTGMLETTAGGALIGAKFGGLEGALIGGAIGLGAGLIRLFVKGAEQKAKEKIRNMYGVNIEDRGILRQIVQMAKQQYGGNLDMAIQTPQIRDLIELYAMTTGQKSKGMPAVMRPFDLSQRGGAVNLNPQYSNGSPVGLSLSAPAAMQPVILKGTFQLDAPATERILKGRAVEAMGENPREVQKAVSTAQRANFQRREMAAMQLAPELLPG